MIQVFILKMIFGAIHNAIQKKKRIKGLEKLQRIDDYVNKDNELDIQLKQQQKTIGKQGRYIEELEKDVAILKRDAHPPIFSEKDKKKIWKSIKKLEKKEK